jgi:hypothetical protein
MFLRKIIKIFAHDRGAFGSDSNPAFLKCEAEMLATRALLGTKYTARGLSERAKEV